MKRPCYFEDEDSRPCKRIKLEVVSKSKVRRKHKRQIQKKVHHACKGWIYMINTELDDCFKIGYTRNLTTRLSTYQTGRALDVQLMHSISCINYQRVEKEIHQYLKIHPNIENVRSEIYKGDPLLIRHAIDTVVQSRFPM